MLPSAVTSTQRLELVEEAQQAHRLLQLSWHLSSTLRPPSLPNALRLA